MPRRRAGLARKEPAPSGGSPFPITSPPPWTLSPRSIWLLRRTPPRPSSPSPRPSTPRCIASEIPCRGPKLGTEGFEIHSFSQAVCGVVCPELVQPELVRVHARAPRHALAEPEPVAVGLALRTRLRLMRRRGTQQCGEDEPVGVRSQPRAKGRSQRGVDRHVLKVWRRGWDSNPDPLLIILNLLILRNGKRGRSG